MIKLYSNNFKHTMNTAKIKMFACDLLCKSCNNKKSQTSLNK